ncbi:LuxR C-terminal-related transcriptional regulator [uncultured Polaribacter sp.]|uniref:helix-turn-helix and ligand-binding sensor domain-containing protein n=1 Tax=uncultured Polaribacter sp. TaxID=174711 RepID=UPI00261B65AA|nr:LuxR C-terminal-related transcriptional regulator [uncultured Polaribacter sp.]
MLYRLKIIIFLLFFLISSIVIGQEIPPILKFQPENYNAENQNWAITQHKDKFIFVANNEGLLEFNGGKWKLYNSPNNTVIRSLLSDKERIYSGAYMDFGYWKRDETGHLKYTSLSKKIKNNLLEDENIWNIKKFDTWVLFQSFHRIYFYNTETEEVSYRGEFNNYYRIFEIDAIIYIIKKNGDLVRLQNDNEELIARFPANYNVKLVLNLFKTNTGFIALTRNQGFFKIKNNTVVKWQLPSYKEINAYQIFCGIKLRDNTYMLGTISNGIIHLSENGKIINRIDQTRGLANNTVLNLFEDIDGNVWSALDNGINCLNVQSNIREFNDDDGQFGTTYCSIEFNNKIYVGTNQGLFYKSLHANEPLKKVKGLKGQVWSLFVSNGDLLCGHTSGTFNIKDYIAKQITDFSGTWNFRKIPNQPNLILQGHYAGMSILKKENGSWTLKNKIEGFQNSARFFEIFQENIVFVNHEYKGVYKLVLSEDYRNFKENELLSSVEKGKGSGLTMYEDKILYSQKKGVFSLSNAKPTFKKNNKLSMLFSEDEYISGKLIADKKNRLWSFNKSTISYLEKGPVKNKLSVKFIPIKNYLRKTTVSFENLSNIYENTYLIGKTNGYLLLDLNKKQDVSHTIFLNEIRIKNNDSVRISVLEEHEFQFSENSLVFEYSSPVYSKYEFVNYQYNLNNSRWVDLGNQSELAFDNLSFGEYELRIKSNIGNQDSDNTILYRFVIKPPIYFTNTAIVLYILLFLLIGYFIHKLNRKYYRKQNEELMKENLRQFEIQKIQADKEVIRLKNDKLSQDIEGKNRELAISTMSIIKRNEFLHSIKKELKKNVSIEEDNEVFKLIEKNLNSTKDWDFFREAFNNADKDFLKRAKKLHPDLTHNNLKFCAYLRLNLSSKEIAPLLNISVKSVEIRRYRLRKKLNLPHETNLTDYILNI